MNNAAFLRIWSVEPRDGMKSTGADARAAVVLPDGTEYPLRISEATISVVAGPEGGISALVGVSDVQLGPAPQCAEERKRVIPVKFEVNVRPGVTADEAAEAARKALVELFCAETEAAIEGGSGVTAEDPR